MAEPTAKRHRPNILWSVEFPSRIELEKVVKSVKEIGMNNFTIKIIKNDSFTGLRAEVTQSGMVCLLRAQLACEVEKTEEEDVDVTLGCEQLLAVLRGSGKPQFRLKMFQHVGENRVHIQSFDTFDHSFQSRTTMATYLNEDTEMLELKELQFEFLLRLDLHFLKQIVKNNMELGSDEIGISVHEVDEKSFFVRFRCSTDHVDDVKELTGRKTLLEESGQTQLLFDESQQKEAFTLSDAARENAKSVFQLKFDMKYLWSFLRASETKGKLKMFLSQENPLLLKIDFFPEDSFIYYLQASKMD
jgi:hypothetical protein